MPLQVEVVSPFPVLVTAGASRLRQQLGAEVSVVERVMATSELGIRHAPGGPTALVARVAAALEPLGLEVGVDAKLSPGVVQLHIGSTADDPFENVNFRLSVNDRHLQESLEEAVVDLCGRSCSDSDVVPVRRSRILYGGAGRFARKAMQLLLLAHGVEARLQREWSTDDMDLMAVVSAPRLAALPPMQQYAIEFYTDDLSAASVVVDALASKGFVVQPLSLEALATSGPAGRHRSQSTTAGERLGTSLAALDDEYGDHPAIIRRVIESTLVGMGVDLADMPLETLDLGRKVPRVVLPIGAFRSGRLRPYGNRHACRYSVVLRGDDRASLDGLVTRFVQCGFARAALEEREGRRAGLVVPPRIVWAGHSPADEVKDAVRALVRAALAECGDTIQVEELDGTGDSDEIRIDLPFASLRAGGLEQLLRQSAASMEVQVLCPSRVAGRAIVDEMRRRGFRRVKLSTSRGRPRPGVYFGAAPRALIEPLCAWLEERFSIACPPHLVWHGEDRDVHVALPALEGDDAPEPSTDEPAESGQKTAMAADAIQAWVFGERHLEGRSFFCQEGSSLLVGDIRLPRASRSGHPRAPRLADLSHYALDETTATTIRLLASAVALREPCLLEGETSTSKTSAILFLAAHLGQPVLRLNLNGQTDTSELMGRYVPSNSGGAPWRWQDGAVVEAMLEGHWLVLDELNLAEPQVLERLNSVLERDPSLVLSEHDGRMIGPAQTHPDFRVFATMNPATYAGRSPLSPAFRDRFRAYRRAPVPGEHDMLAFLRAAVLGEGTAISVAGRTYLPEPRVASHATLSGCAVVMNSLPALARFHAGVTSAFGAASGPSPRERHSFTRRALLSLLDFMAAGEPSESRLREALVRYYIERVPPSEQPTMLRLLDASGLGPGTWAPVSSSSPPAPRVERREGDDASPDDDDLMLDAMLAHLAE